MAGTSVIGGGPVNILTDSGVQHGIPLSLLSMKDGAIDTSRLDPTIAAVAAPVLKALVQVGALVAGQAQAPVLALDLKAKVAGSAGNAISVTFAGVTPDPATPGNTTVNVTLDFTDERTGLTPASIGSQLGIPGGGTAPGLVTLTAPAAHLPAKMAPTKLAGAPLTLDIPADGGGPAAFTLQAVGGDAALADLTVAIDLDKGAGTFTLMLALDRHIPAAKLSDLQTDLGLLLDVQPGAGGFAPPAAGMVTLSGGADAIPPKAAEAMILSQ